MVEQDQADVWLWVSALYPQRLDDKTFIIESNKNISGRDERGYFVPHLLPYLLKRKRTGTYSVSTLLKEHFNLGTDLDSLIHSLLLGFKKEFAFI